MCATTALYAPFPVLLRAFLERGRMGSEPFTRSGVPSPTVQRLAPQGQTARRWPQLP